MPNDTQNGPCRDRSGYLAKTGNHVCHGDSLESAESDLPHPPKKRNTHALHSMTVPSHPARSPVFAHQLRRQIEYVPFHV
jgi:hypothetical protein